MLKKFLPLLLIPGILFSAVIEKEIRFAKPVIYKGMALMPGCRLSREAFAPIVSVRPVSLLLPAGQTAVSFEVTYDDPILLDGQFYLQPCKQDGRISVCPPKDYLTRSSPVYDKNEFFPGSVKSENFYTQIKNGHRIFITVLNPLQYNPATGEIRYYDKIKVTVNTAATRDNSVYKCTPLIKSQLMNLVDNKEAVANLPYSKTGPNDYDYLIVTIDALKDSYSSFIEFNKRRGLRTKVQTIPYIKSNISGTDDPDKVRNYINQEYKNNNIVFVLLGGDDDNTNANDVPKRGLHAQMYDYGTDFNDDKDIAADIYFSCLDGDWKGSNQYYGEFGTEDIGYEVYAARFPADNATELTNLMDKTIKYSEQPVMNAAVNNLLLGEYAWGPPDHPVECWGGDCMDQLLGTCTKNNYTTTGFSSPWTTTKLYDKNSTWTKAQFISAVRDKKITWIDHVGHSNINYIFKLYTQDVTNTNFTANGTTANFFIAYTYGCYPGSWDNKQSNGSYSSSDCIAEAFTAQISNGCVAFISNTRVGLGDDGTASADGTDGSSQRYIRHFHDAIFGKKIHFLEMMNAYSKEVNKDLICESDIKKKPYFGQMKWCAYQLCALGDPALSIWTADPQQLPADHPKQLNQDLTYTWDTKKAYTTVALLSGDGATILYSQITGEDGKCAITDDAVKNYALANPTGKMKINVKAHNYLPYSGEISWATGINTNTDFLSNNNFTVCLKTGRINYVLPADGFVNISLYDSKGALVKTIVNGTLIAGEHHVALRSEDVSNGIYYCRMTTSNKNLVKKLVIAK